MPEPTIIKDIATWDCDDATGYTLAGLGLDDTVAKGFVIAPNAMDTMDDLDDSDFSNWADSSTLTQDTGTLLYGASTAKAQSSAADTSRLILADLGLGPLGAPQIYDGCWFKLNSLSGYTDNCWVIWTSDRLGTAIVMGFGVNTAISTSTFSYYNNATTSWTDTGIALDTNRHKIAFTSEDLGGTMTFTMDGTTIYTGNSSNTRAFVVRTSQSTKTCNIDRIYHNNEGFYTTSTLETPLAQPLKVQQWLSLAVTSTTINANKGTLAHKFQWSTDGGSTWNGTWLDVSDANLQDIVCDWDGNDAIKFQPTFTPYISMYTPLLSKYVLTYSDGYKITSIDTIVKVVY